MRCNKLILNAQRAAVLVAVVFLTLSTSVFTAQAESLEAGKAESDRDEIAKKRAESIGRISRWRSNLGEPEGPLTPAQAVQQRFSGEYTRISRKASNPVITGTVLILRAVTEFNHYERSIFVDDAVRHLRKNPDSDKDIWRVVATYKRNNPHLSDHVEKVRMAIGERLAAAE